MITVYLEDTATDVGKALLVSDHGEILGPCTHVERVDRGQTCSDSDTSSSDGHAYSSVQYR